MAVITTISSTTTSTSTTTTTETSEIANFPVNDEDLQRMLSDIKHSGSEKIYEEEPEEQIKEYIERETTISNYPRAYPIPGFKTAYNKFSENWPGQMGKRIVKEGKFSN